MNRDAHCGVLPPAHRATILVVEDDPQLRFLYRMSLMIAGYNVAAVEDGVDALRHIEANAPHAVVLDIELPRLGGFDVQHEIASHTETRDIPIVVVTGTLKEINPKDFACVLRKPISPEALVEAVERCLRARGKGC